MSLGHSFARGGNGYVIFIGDVPKSGSAHAIRQYFLACRHEGLQLVIEALIKGGAFIVGQHLFPHGVGADALVFLAVVAPLFVGIVVGDLRAPEGGFKILLGMGATEIMRARAYFADGIKRLTIFGKVYTVVSPHNNYSIKG